MKFIDIDTWNRKTAYQNFIGYTHPIFSLATRLDITNLLAYCEEKGRAFFPTFLYVVTKCANSVEEMRLRIVDGKVALFDTVHPSYIVIRDNEDLVTQLTPFVDEYDAFYHAVKEQITIAKNGGFSDFNANFRADCYYVSCLPWVEITSLSNPYNMNDPSASSIPRITWGKYTTDENGKSVICLDIAAHHALIDGRQAVRVFEKITAAIEHINEFLGGKE